MYFMLFCIVLLILCNTLLITVILHVYMFYFVLTRFLAARVQKTPLVLSQSSQRRSAAHWSAS